MNTTRYTLRNGDDKWWQVMRAGDEQFGLDKSKFTRAQATVKVKQCNDGIPKYDMQQVERFRFKVEGAASGEYVCCHDLAEEAWGKRSQEENLAAMAYLWRRFGPPWSGTDSHKRIAAWILTTPDPEVFLEVSPSASGMAYNTMYIVRRGIFAPLYGSPAEHRTWNRKFEKWFIKKNPQFNLKDPVQLKAAQELFQDWRWNRIREAEKSIGKYPFLRPLIRQKGWRKGPPVVRRVNQALFDAMKELLRPVGIRDLSINIFGRVKDIDMPEADPSIYAGLGVPRDAMEKLRKSDGKSK